MCALRARTGSGTQRSVSSTSSSTSISSLFFLFHLLRIPLRRPPFFSPPSSASSSSSFSSSALEFIEGSAELAGKPSERHPRPCRADQAAPKDRLKQIERGTHEAQGLELALYIGNPLGPRARYRLLALLLSWQSLMLSFSLLLSSPMSLEAPGDI